MTPPSHLRVIDFGVASPLRSQTLWHAIAQGVSGGAPSTLSFVRPSGPYVSIGYHRRLEEVDTDECRRRGWPVYRRMVGGGPVYLDGGQLFFQITVPMAELPPARPKALRHLLAPAVAAYRAAGIEAEIDDRLEIVVGDRKICGYGAGQIGDAAIVVGNLIETFDHEAAAASLRTPSPGARRTLEELMRRYVAPTPADPVIFRDAAIDAYSLQLALPAQSGELNDGELHELDELDRRFENPEWLAGADRAKPAAWQVKVRAGVFMFAAAADDTTMIIGVDGGRVVTAELHDPELNGSTASLQDALIDLDLALATTTLEAAGAPGRRLSELLALAEPRRL
jgi:lipoate---protein ligase